MADLVVGGWEVETDVDDATAYAALATDRLWCGYAIADLDPPFRADSQVAVARRCAPPPRRTIS